MFIQTEQTPNPETLKFLTWKSCNDKGTAFYQNIEEAGNSPLAKRCICLRGCKKSFFW